MMVIDCLTFSGSSTGRGLSGKGRRSNLCSMAANIKKSLALTNVFAGHTRLPPPNTRSTLERKIKLITNNTCFIDTCCAWLEYYCILFLSLTRLS